MYYKGADIATGSISGVNHDETYKARGIGIQSLREIKNAVSMYLEIFLLQVRKNGRPFGRGGSYVPTYHGGKRC